MMLMKNHAFKFPVQSGAPDTEKEVVAVPRIAVLEQGNVYVHCHYPNGPLEMMIRIWRSTFLIDQASGSRSPLLHAENITLAPAWTPVPPNREHRFLLIFQALPAGCTMFDLLEDIPESGGFHVSSILRNESDIYHVVLEGRF